MIGRKIVSVLAGIAMFVMPAWATPERLTTSEDQVFAASQNHLYVLRDIVDNLGSYYEALHDQHLIEIDLDTGEATRFWPVRRMYVSSLDTGDLLVPGAVTERAGDTQDMMDVLRDVGAQPMSPEAWEEIPLTMSAGALMRGEEQMATPFAIRATGRGQLGVLRDAYPPIETEEEYMRKEQIDFYDLYAPGDWLCQLRPERHTILRAADKVTVAKMHCEDADLTGVWSFHMLIKDDL